MDGQSFQITARSWSVCKTIKMEHFWYQEHTIKATYISSLLVFLVSLWQVDGLPIWARKGPERGGKVSKKARSSLLSLVLWSAIQFSCCFLLIPCNWNCHYQGFEPNYIHWLLFLLLVKFYTGSKGWWKQACHQIGDTVHGLLTSKSASFVLAIFSVLGPDSLKHWSLHTCSQRGFYLQRD